MIDYAKERPETIQKMFASIADDYDRANTILSFNMHKYWNRQLVDQVKKLHPTATPLLDLCSGTGEIAFAFLQNETEPHQATLLDFCAEMLEFAKAKSSSYCQHHFNFIQADAMALPLPDASYPIVTMAYGIRNIQDPLKSMHEIYRVLKPGGVLGILELTRPTHPVLKMGHALYLKTCLPLLGRLVTSNAAAYKYLCRSIQGFVSPENLISQLQSVKFMEVEHKTLSLGAASLFLARKPVK